jgi:hypothetical protein
LELVYGVLGRWAWGGYTICISAHFSNQSIEQIEIRFIIYVEKDISSLGVVSTINSRKAQVGGSFLASPAPPFAMMTCANASRLANTTITNVNKLARNILWYLA